MSLALDNPELLRSNCFIGGKWTGAPATPVHNPATGEIVDAINVRKLVESRSNSLSGTGALLETVSGRFGRSLGGLAPDITRESTRKECMDRALRAVIELAVVELAKRRSEWIVD